MQLASDLVTYRSPRTCARRAALMSLLLLVIALLPASSALAQRFAVIGDYGYAGPDAAAVAEMVHSWNVDFIVTTGDNNYPFGETETIDANIGQYYSRYIYPYNGSYTPSADEARFFPALGNHDWYSMWCEYDTCRGPYVDYFELPGNERYYDVTWGNVHLFIIDSDSLEPHGVLENSRQAEWLRDGLAASTATWHIVAMHHPPFSSGVHGSTEHLRWPYQEWGADVVLNGHNHVYERVEVNELPYFTVGLGGRNLYWFVETPLPESKVRYADGFGAMRVEASPEELKIAFLAVGDSLVDEIVLTAPSTVAREHPRPERRNLEVYPNPATNLLSVLLPAVPAEGAVLELVDILGRTVIQRQHPHGGLRATMDLHALTPGAYFLRVRTSKGVQVRPVIVGRKY